MQLSPHVKKSLTAVAFGSLAGASSAATVAVSEDGYINAFSSQRAVVQGGGIGEELQVRTPSGSGAFQYNNLAVLGFDTTGVDLSAATAATLTFTVARRSTAAGIIRLYLLNDNSGGDSFDETTLTYNSAIADLGVVRTDTIVNNQVTGAETVGELTQGAAGDTMSFTLAGAALTSLQGSGGNNFVTFIAESRTPFNNPTFAIASKENTTYSGASLEVVPEPSSALLAACTVPFAFLRRRR